jgi:phage tail sheath gpL-like
MSAISTAIGLERLSRVSGYKIKKGFFDNSTPNLPQIIALFAEANLANQGSLNEDKRELTSADEAGQLYGYGSPIHQIMRILRPIGSEGVGGIPTVVFPQKSSLTATQTAITWQISGNALKNGVHSVRIAGRENLDFKNYSYTVVKNDTPAIIIQKMVDSVNSVLNSPVIASVGATTDKIVFTTKWAGSTSSELKISFNINDDLLGLTYAETASVNGVGLVDLSNALSQFGSDWYTCVINSYGEDVFNVLEQFNGVPSANSPTGRYSGSEFKPFMAYFGSTLSDKDDLSAITDDSARVEQVTNVLCPAPSSEGFPWEAATNVVRLFARTMQDSPEIDINGQSYPDMPIPVNGLIGDMSVYDNRDFLVKKGCSTVILDKGSYKVQEIVTTYHPDGETPLQYNYCRNLNLDWNVADSYRILENRRLKDRVLIRDEQVTDSPNAIKPKEWKATLFDLFDDLAKSALINEPDFSKKSLQVQISANNPNRFETFFRYKRTGIARIESTDVEAGF